MKSRHITKILDRTEFSRISAEDSSAIGEHIKSCAKCRAAFQSAKIASLLLKEKSLAETPLPRPFFQAKVLNAWREKQSVKKPLAAFWHWWQASATLVLLMFLTVAGLMTLSLVGDHYENSVNRRTGSEDNLYSADRVILNQNPPRSLTIEQVFKALDDNR